MRSTLTILLSFYFYLAVNCQTQIVNGGFENWGNPSPGNSNEPTSWYSNKSGSNVAQLGPQTCFQDGTVKHSGSYSARIETKYYILAVVNGNMTTGVVDAPNSTKSEGFIGSINYSTASDIRRMSFTGRPDSLVGWYQYTQATGGSGASAEKGKIRAILHVGNYYDPEIPVNSNHPDSSINKIGDALFFTPVSNVGSWTRFSVPFNYVSGSNPAYIMISATSSANQNTTAPNSSSTGSKMWIDDLSVIYNSGAGIKNHANEEGIKVFCFENILHVNFLNKTNTQSVVSVYDLTGKLVSSQNVRNSELNSIDLTSLNSGLYLYQVLNTSNGNLTTGKIIIE